MSDTATVKADERDMTRRPCCQCKYWSGDGCRRYKRYPKIESRGWRWDAVKGWCEVTHLLRHGQHYFPFDDNATGKCRGFASCDGKGAKQ